MATSSSSDIRRRFAGYLPVVLDCETGGVDPQRHALLEVAAVALHYEGERLVPMEPWHYHIAPFEGAKITEESLEVTQIKPYHPFRFALKEVDFCSDLSIKVNNLVREKGCRRAILVAHNAAFDLSFIQAAYARSGCLRSCPFHRFTTFDTATMAGVFYQETVLAKALRRAKIPFDIKQAHSALYDTQVTAELFCQMIAKIDSNKIK